MAGLQRKSQAVSDLQKATNQAYQDAIASTPAQLGVDAHRTAQMKASVSQAYKEAEASTPSALGAEAMKKKRK